VAHRVAQRTKVLRQYDELRAGDLTPLELWHFEVARVALHREGF